jgi:hypothetical protein
MDDSIRATILSVFDRHRERPGAPFEEARFLHFLMADNRPLKDVRNSFAGLRRLNAFYDALQLDCAVCLDVNAPEKDWSVDALAWLIAEKKANLQAQKVLVRKRVEQANANVLYEPLKFGLILIVPTVALAWAVSGGGMVGRVALALGVVVELAIYLIARREAQYYAKLRRVIEQ